MIPPSSFLSDMTAAINQKENSDIVFILDDGSEIYAHKAILVSRSDYFTTIFEGSSTPSLILSHSQAHSQRRSPHRLGCTM